MEENISLKSYTTFNIGGPAFYFTSVRTLTDLKQAFVFARKNDLPTLILGGGSNIIVPDNGFPGLVIKMEFTGVTFKEVDQDIVHAIACAGENWDQLVQSVVAKKLYGIENLSGIPGTIGAAPIQNIGAYGTDISETIVWVEVLDTSTMEVKQLSNTDCAFAYRDSIFKKTEGSNLIITRVCLKLCKKGEFNTTYKDVQQYIKNEKPVTKLREMRDAIIAIRSKKFPDLKKVGTAGSFFENPIVLKKEAERLLLKYPDIPVYKQKDGSVKVPLAFILDRLGFKGVRVGNVGTFEKQPLVIVSYDGATEKELRAFANNISKKVKQETNLAIVPEVTFVNT